MGTDLNQQLKDEHLELFNQTYMAELERDLLNPHKPAKDFKKPQTKYNNPLSEFTRIYTNLNLHEFTRIYTNLNLHEFTQIYTNLNLHEFTRIYTHTHTHTHTHI